MREAIAPETTATPTELHCGGRVRKAAPKDPRDHPRVPSYAELGCEARSTRSAGPKPWAACRGLGSSWGHPVVPVIVAPYRA